MKIIAILLLLPGFAWAGEALDLRRCMAMAAPLSPQLRSAQLDLSVAEAAYVSAKALFYPSLGLHGSETLFGDTVSAGRVEDPLQWNPDTYQASLTAHWNLFNSGKDYFGLRLAKAGLESARQALWRERQDLGMQVLRAYYDLLKQRHLLEVAQRDLEQKKDRLEQAKTLYEGGSRSYSDLVRQQVQVNLSERELSNQRSQGLIAEARMASLLGLDPGHEVALVDNLGDTRAAPSVEGSGALALKNRAEIRALRYSLMGSEASLMQANLNRLPSVGLDLNYAKDLGLYGRDSTLWTHNGRGDENSTWSAVASLSVPIFQGFALTAAVDSAKASRDKAAAALAEAERGALLEARIASLNLEQHYENLALDQGLVEAAELNLREVKKGYEHGTASLFELNDADTSKLKSVIDQLNGIYDYQVSRAEWKRALGLDLWSEGD